jgi:O-antigen/teichoic acid export membrane protein
MKARIFMQRLSTKDARRFYRGMLAIVLGTGTARAIGIASIPVLTRIYSPEDYGILAIFVALVSIIAPVLTLRYPLALPLPRRDATAVNLLVLSMALIALTSLIVASFLFAVSGTVLQWLSMESLAPWWWLIIIGAQMTAIYESLSLWATRRRAYGIIAKTKVIQSFLGESAKLVLGYLGAKPFGLLAGSIIEQGSASSFFFRQFKHDFLAHRHRIRLKYARRLFRGYVQFPIFRLPSQFLLVLSTQAPAILSASLYGPETTGQLNLALMALAVPSSLVGRAAGQAFYGEIAKFKRGEDRKIKALTYAVQRRLFLFGTPVSITVFIFGENIFSMLFGHNWSTAGSFAASLSPFILFQLTSAPLIQVLNVYKKQAAFLVINASRLLGLLLIYWICSRLQYTSAQFVTALSAFLFTFYLATSIYILTLVSRRARSSNPTTERQ